jgi:hypothetical protein
VVLSAIDASCSDARWLMSLGEDALPELTSLSLAHFSGVSLSGFPKTPKLASLNLMLSHSIIDVSALVRVPSLTHIDLRGCPNVTDVTSLASLPDLQSLQVDGTAVDVTTLPDELRRVTR